MNLLVTGGLGFIGTNFIKLISNKYPTWNIAIVDKQTYASNSIKLPKNCELFKTDINNVSRMEGIDIAINFAAETHVDRSIDDSTPFFRTNVLGTQNLLEQARKYGVKRFIQISTDEVYGSIRDGKFKEEAKLNPTSPYAASKASADLLALSYYKTYGLPIIITRSTNNYGPYQYPEKLIPLFIKKTLEDEALPLYGDGENIRDWLYVEDNCLAIEAVMLKGKEGEIYNIGANNYLKNVHIANEILSLLGKPQSLIMEVDDRLGHDFRYAVNTDKIESLGWKPRKTFMEGLKETVEWYKSTII